MKLSLLLVVMGLGLVVSCQTPEQTQISIAPSSSSTITSSTKPTVSPIAASPTPTPKASAPKASASPTTRPSKSTAPKPPLTVEKLKNTDYYLFAKGPVRLVNGRYEDPASKRVVSLDDVWIYADVTKDGVKDAIASLTVTVPNSGEFSYLAVVANEAGLPKNIATEFLGDRTKVKAVKVKPDQQIEVQITQYDANGTPSADLTRTLGLKPNQSTSTQK